MQLHSLQKKDVQVLCPHCDPVLQFFAVEKEWFATDDNKLLGVVLYHRPNKDWAFVIFGPNLRGCYHWIAGESQIASQAAATALLRAEMHRIAQTGQEVFPRPLQRLLRSIKMGANRRRSRRAARRAARNRAAAQLRWPAIS